MSLVITGVGSCFPEDYPGGEYPYKDYLPKSIRRMSGKLARMVYIAAVNALTHAGILDQAGKIPVIFASAMSEIGDGIELLNQIAESGGTSVSPALVQNSVANAPASLLSIGLSDTCSALTVSQSFLSLEAAADAALILAETSSTQRILLVAADEYREEWGNLLNDRGGEVFQHQLHEKKLKEGAAAVILSTSQTEKPSYGAIHEAGVFHGRLPDSVVQRLSFCDKIFLRKAFHGPLGNLEVFSGKYGVQPNLLAYTDSSLVSPLADLISLIRKKQSGSYAFLTGELNETGFLLGEVF